MSDRIDPTNWEVSPRCPRSNTRCRLCHRVDSLVLIQSRLSLRTLRSKWVLRHAAHSGYLRLCVGCTWFSSECQHPVMLGERAAEG